MSIQSIKINIGNETKELTLEEARDLKNSLDEFFENRSIKESLDKLIDKYRPYWIPPCTVAPSTSPWIIPQYDPMKPYCTTIAPLGTNQ